MNAEERAIRKKSESRDTTLAMMLQSGLNQNNNRGKGRNGNPRGHGRGFNNFGPNIGFNNGQSSSHPTFGFHNGSSSRNASNPSQFSRPQSNFQVKNGSGTPTTQVLGQNFPSGDVPSNALFDVSSLVTSPSPVTVALAKPMPQSSLPPT